MPKSKPGLARGRAPAGISVPRRPGYIVSGLFRVLAALLAVVLLGGAPRAAGQESVKVSAASSKDAIVPGDQFAVAVIFQIEPGWHINTQDPVVPGTWEAAGFEPFSTEIVVAPVPGLRFGPIQWPKVHEIKADLIGTGKPEAYGVFEGEAIVFIPVIAEPSITQGTVKLSVTVKHQACNDKTCLLPGEAELPLAIKVATVVRPITNSATQKYFADFDASIFAKTTQFGSVPPVKPKKVKLTAEQIAAGKARELQKVTFDAFGLGYTVDTGSPVGLVLLVMTAVLGGLVLNFTPCVLPVIPLKIMSLSASAENPRRCLLLGAMMSLGVVAFWLTLGALIAFSTNFKAVSQLSSIPWFNLGVGLFMAVMGAGMLGAFSVQLPQWVYSINPKHDTLHGSFMFGVMTAVLTTPCTAPFAGAATAWGSTQAPSLTLMVFAALGVGMSIPYLLLSARPSLVEKMPRAGPAGDLVKQVLGLLLFAVAAFFVGTGAISLVAEKPYLARVLYWWGVAIMCLVAGLWLILRTVQIAERPFNRVFFAFLGVVLAAVPVYIAVARTRASAEQFRTVQAGESVWLPYTEEGFDRALASGKAVVLDFTADWCLNCITLRQLVLDREPVKDALKHDGIVAFEVDLTSREAPGWKKLKELGEVSIPLLAVFTPGNERPWKSNGYTVAQVVDQVDLARSRATKQAGGGGAATPAALVPTGDPAPSGSGR